MEKDRQHPQHESGSRVVLGVVLLFFGFLWLGKNLHFLPPRFYIHFFSWEVILMIIGLVLLFSRNNRSVGAVLLLVGGVFFLLGQLHVPLSGRDIFWPVVMIAGGLVMLIRMSGQARYHGQEALAPGDYIDELSILGSNHKVITSQNFRGGRILSLMGGTKLDLRQAKLAPGTNVLEVVTLFGGVKLTVPPEWEVQPEVTSILGGFTDNRLPDLHTPKEPGKALVLKGVVILGGGEING